jgi:hypothetical protein
VCEPSALSMVECAQIAVVVVGIRERENRKSSNTAEITKQTVSKCKLMFMLLGA